MKNIIFNIIALSLIILAILSNTLLAATLDLNITANKKQIKKDQEIEITVSWSEGMQAADFSLKYDTEKLKYIRSDIDDLFIYNNLEKEEVQTTWFSTEDKDKTAITYTFKAIQSGSAEFNTVINGGFATGNLELPTDYNNANLTIKIQNDLIIYPIIIAILLIFIVFAIIIKGGKKHEKNYK